jgi:hypothetical protein
MSKTWANVSLADDNVASDARYDPKDRLIPNRTCAATTIKQAFIAVAPGVAAAFALWS